MRALNPKTAFCVRSRRGEDTDQKMQCDQGCRNWRDAATSQGMLAATRSGKG